MKTNKMGRGCVNTHIVGRTRIHNFPSFMNDGWSWFVNGFPENVVDGWVMCQKRIKYNLAQIQKGKGQSRIYYFFISFTLHATVSI